MSKRTQEEVEEDVVEIATKPTSTGPLKQKVLAISTRSVNARNRHLLEDLRSLMPHSKKEAKVESKVSFDQVFFLPIFLLTPNAIDFRTWALLQMTWQRWLDATRFSFSR